MTQIFTKKWNFSIGFRTKNKTEFVECKLNSPTLGSGAFSFALTAHAVLRCKQRKIGQDILALALCCAKTVKKQGVLFHVVSEHLLPADLPKRLKNGLKNLVVITDDSVSAVITAYYTAKGLIKSNKKRKDYRPQLVAI